MIEPRPLMDTLGRVALEAGALLRAWFSGPREVTKKGRVDLVTDADRAAEALVRERLLAAFPGAGLVLEEGGEERAPGEGYEGLTFIVDPLDGTTNYAAGIPHFAVSLGAAHAEAGLFAGAVYDPCRDELFLAAKGEGTFLGGRRLRVSATGVLEDSVVATGFAYDRAEGGDNNHAEFAALNLATRGARRFGAAALDFAWVAAGRYDAYWERGLKPWDAAAGALLVEEAGGRVTGYAGGPFELARGEVLASNGALHEAVQHALARARAKAGLGG